MLRERVAEWLPVLKSARRVVAAGALAGVCFVIADTWARDDWQEVAISRHLPASAWLWVAWGVGVGLGLSLLELGARWLSHRLARWQALRAEPTRQVRFRLDLIVPIALLGLLAGWGAHQLLLPLVSHGKAAKLSALAWPAGLALGGVVLVGRWLVQRAGKSRSTRAALGFAALFLVIAAVSIGLDLTILVSLYASLHALLEAIALLSLIASIWCVLAELERRTTWAQRAVGWVAGVAAVSLVVFPFARARLFDELKPAWREPVYIGRLMARVQTVEHKLAGEESAGPAGIQRLRQTYDLSVTGPHSVWQQPKPLSAATEAQLQELRPEPERLNVLVYYIDTLRADVAANRELMPNVVKFCAESLCFDRAYSAASDTVGALPVAIGGRYGGENRAPSALDQAERAGRETTLLIPRSAGEFLQRQLPSFRFSRVVTIPDYAPGEQVWGYGATGPTAARLVDRAIEVLFEGEAKEPQSVAATTAPLLAPRNAADAAAPIKPAREAQPPFFGWLFNFDVHNWRELKQDYVEERATALGVPESDDQSWRYYVAARAVDEEFGRLLRELDERGLRESTLVVLMSDHGEALGRHGFWVHSTFLWESLVRVPLAIRVPGVRPQRVSVPVSLADLGPTLVRALAPGRSLAGYHGEDLLVHALAAPPPRRLPILMEAWHKEDRLRVGLVDPVRRLKLVVPLESGVPELHRLDDEDPEANERSQDESTALVSMLNELIGSPVFPRPAPPKPGVAAR